MTRFQSVFPLLLLALGSSPANAAVVINEIFYHAPDDVEDLQYIELYNAGDQPVDAGDWKFTKGVRYEFPAKTQIAANGYWVICRDADRFKEFYGLAADGTFGGSLKRSGDRIELVNAQGDKVDGLKYADIPPWAAGADGYSASLERISPFAASDLPQNWAASPLSGDGIKPAGTPGKQNACYSANLPPVISEVEWKPLNPAPEEPVTVAAVVQDPDGVREVNLRYRLASSGSESEETAIVMTSAGEHRFTAAIPGQKLHQIIRFRLEAVDQKGTRRVHPAAGEPRPAFSALVHEQFEPGKIPFALIINVGEAESQAAAERRKRPDRGGFGGGPGGRGFPFFGRLGSGTRRAPERRSAFVFIDPATRTPELFDFVNVAERSGGYKVRFQKDRPLNGMTSINLIFEYNDRFVLAEPLAYELYRRAGNAAELTDFARLWIDGEPVGYHLLVEQPNRAFLRRNKLDDDGNLYKILWYERGLVGQHEKKTHVHDGHDDLLQLVESLEKTSGDEQWAVIKKNFNVEQVINYFAVNTCLSHWDGFFNNYFTYHDVNGSGKWEMVPWDQDKTWGFHDGIGEGEVFHDMPLTFGMEGDVPPGRSRDRGPGRGFGGFGGPFGGGPGWWRPGGYFSKPLLANPRFRKLYLARTREILETIYTPEVFFPIIDGMGDRIREEVRIRAEVSREDPDRASRRLEQNLRSLKEHLVKRRQFLLDQEELRAAGEFERSELKE